MRLNQQPTQLPDKEQVSIFFQALQNIFTMMPGQPFATLYRVAEKRYQLLQQVLYFKTELFNYLENFIATMLNDAVTSPDTLYDAYINICQAIPDVFRDLGKEQSQGYVINVVRMLKLPHVCVNADLYQAAILCIERCLLEAEPDQR